MTTPATSRPVPASRGPSATGRATATRPATEQSTSDQPTYPPVAGRGHNPAPKKAPSKAPTGGDQAATATGAPLPPWSVLAALVGDLDGQHRRERQAYEQGYRDGHRSGWEIGYDHAHREMATRWAALAAQIRQTARTSTHDELDLKRWDGRREDFARPRPTDRQSRLAAALARRQSA